MNADYRAAMGPNNKSPLQHICEMLEWPGPPDWPFHGQLKKISHFLNALAMKKHIWPFYKIWPIFWPFFSF